MDGKAITQGDFCPQVPFKRTQSIHVALQKSCNYDLKLLNQFFKKKYKNHNISTSILPLGMTWVSKEAVS